MKRIMILTLLLNVGNLVFGNEYIQKKVQEFPMGNYDNGVYLRHYEQVAPQDDITKNYLVFTQKGDLCIYQADSSRMIYLNDNLQIEKEIEMDLLIHAYDLMYTENYLLMTDKIARIYLFDYQLQQKAYFELYDIFSLYGQGVCLTSTYYDEVSDIVFFKDTEDNLHSIIHPSLNDEENRKNYKNPDETLMMFNSGNYFTNDHISLYKNKYLVIDGIINYWGRQNLGKYTYQVVNSHYVNLWDGKNSLPIKFDYDSENEIESIAIHPCGDIYILRMNWQTNTHNLYCIENTWDPQWREEWRLRK